MGLNKDLLDAARELPRADEPDVVGAERHPTSGELFVNGDRDELARRAKAELSADAYALVWAWADVVESETGAYYGDVEVRTVASIARHFPGLEGAAAVSTATSRMSTPIPGRAAALGSVTAASWTMRRGPERRRHASC